MIVSYPDLSAEAGPACVLGGLAVCLLLLLRTERASRVSGELHGCKPRGARGVCALRRAACQSSELIRAYTRQTDQDSPTSNSWRAACRRLPRTAHHGLTRGVCRIVLLLMLASWPGGCDAAGTNCSYEPTACDGTYSSDQYGRPSLCAPLPYPPRTTNERRPAGGGEDHNLFARGREGGAGRGQRAALRGGRGTSRICFPP